MPAPTVEVLRAEARLFRREPGAIFWILAFPPLLLLAFGLIPTYRAPVTELGGQRMIDFSAASIVLVALVTAGLQTLPATLAGYRESGVLRRLRTTPARPASLLVAQLVLHALAAALSAILVVSSGRLVYGVRLPQHLLAYLTTLALAVTAMLAMGAVIAAISPTGRIATAIGLSVFFPAMFAAGIYVPLHALPESVRQTVDLTPFGAGAQALAQAATGIWPEPLRLFVLVLWTLVFLGVAVRWFRWE